MTENPQNEVNDLDNTNQQQELDAVLEKLPVHERRILTKRLYRSPVMPPEMAERYESLLAGSTNRILVLAEKEQAHRHARENRIIEQGFKHAHLGLNYGLIAFVI